MNVDMGIVAAQFLSWEYLFRIFGIISLQSVDKKNNPGGIVGTNCEYVDVNIWQLFFRMYQQEE
jgi:hypothetical protein